MNPIKMNIIAGVDYPLNGTPYAVKGKIIWKDGGEPVMQFNGATLEIYINGMNPINPNFTNSYLEIQNVYRDHYAFLIFNPPSGPDSHGRNFNIRNAVAYYKSQSYQCQGSDPEGSHSCEARNLTYDTVQLDLEIQEMVNGNWTGTHNIKGLTARRTRNWFCCLFPFFCR